MKNFLTSTFAVLAFNVTQPTISQETNPSLTLENGYILSIPTLGTENSPGMYQNIKLKSVDAELTWSLVSGHTADLINTVNSVSVIQTNDFPVQVFLKVEGDIGTCIDVGKYAFTFSDNTFNAFLYFDPLSIPEGGASCVDQTAPFTKILQIPTYGLNPGEYSFSINGKLSGSFSLSEKNVLP